MSLLIKALQKAEQGKSSGDKVSVSDDGLPLELEPVAGPDDSGADSFSQPLLSSSQVQRHGQKTNKQQVASTLFTAKNAKSNNPSSRKLLLIGGMSLLLLLAGISFYVYLNSFQQPEIVLAHPVTALSSAQRPLPPAETQTQANNSSTDLVPAQPPTQVNPETAPVTISEAVDKSASVLREKPEPMTESSKPSPQSQPSKSQQPGSAMPVARNEKEAVKITRNNPLVGINPNLLSAYQAFNAGDDASAQRLYLQVLQSDIRNVDALLGMAAIASRQNRDADAAGWYSKVLEVEPRNSVAQAAMISALGQTDPIGSESRIKSLLGQQPEGAHLYAALGNLYAEQSQWPLAQQAYFQALHFDAGNAEYAFNLAVSLDQLGKSALALQYYQRAQELLPQHGVGSIDRAQLESRIEKLQQSAK